MAAQITNVNKVASSAGLIPHKHHLGSQDRRR